MYVYVYVLELLLCCSLHTKQADGRLLKHCLLFTNFEITAVSGRKNPTKYGRLHVWRQNS